ncbi:hypothetical protein [Flavobacterium johnsoniae]|jgi:hypothetical protein|uniref:Lipoprotein n=1 Tax=Flavobacterium johnsoniae TaxID=986 RepID=A0A1J7BPD4_FLAJO|nr:hypothetical protein [Flavobacterium johnsoniae]OIV40437.1 hypothetical protein BKM63_16225 [Flavobacterium johnsoniae]
MKNFSMLLIAIFFFSCQQKENKNISVSKSDSAVTKKNTEENTTENKAENKQVGDTIFMNYKDEKDIFIAEGVVDSIHPRVYMKFKIEDRAELKARIVTPSGGGNIRFNQIIFPDKSTDGPFGMDLKIHLKQKGNYIFVISHSLMADNPYWGKFRVELESKKE